MPSDLSEKKYFTEPHTNIPLQVPFWKFANFVFTKGYLAFIKEQKDNIYDVFFSVFFLMCVYVAVFVLKNNLESRMLTVFPTLPEKELARIQTEVRIIED